MFHHGSLHNEHQALVRDKLPYITEILKVINCSLWKLALSPGVEALPWYGRLAISSHTTLAHTRVCTVVHISTRAHTQMHTRNRVRREGDTEQGHLAVKNLHEAAKRWIKTEWQSQTCLKGASRNKTILQNCILQPASWKSNTFLQACLFKLSGETVHTDLISS